MRTTPGATKIPPSDAPDTFPSSSPVLVRCFRWWVRGYVARHFHAVRIARHCRPSIDPDLPLIIVLNHPSWWDPLICILLSNLFAERAHFAPMADEALARYSFFSRLGFYGVEQGTSRGAVHFLRTTQAVLARPNTAVWITAQGKFTDARARPPRLRRGIGHLARRLDRGVVLPLALEYPFWSERLPEALARFGEPITIPKPDLGPDDWVETIERHLSSVQDALATDALSRDPRNFHTLVSGNVGIGGVYDQWRRLVAWCSGKPFKPQHDAPEE